MFERFKKQKVDVKTLLAAVDVGLDNWMDASGTDALIAETGKTRQQILDAVKADDEVESCSEDLRTAMLAEPWRIWGEDVSEDVTNRFYRIVRKHLETFVELALLAKFGGYAVAEYVYKQEEDGFLVLDKVLNKDGELDKYTPQRNGSVTYQDANGEEVEINQTVKYLLLTSKAVPARPAGEMMIIRAYPAVCLRKRGWAYAGQFVKRYAQPYVVGKQGGMGAMDAFVKTLYSFINGGAAAVGAEEEINLHQLNGDGEAFERLERLSNRRIQKLLLGRVKTSELTSGSRSAQETEEETRQDRISGYLSLLAKALQHALEAMILVNKHYGMLINAPQGVWFEYEQQFSVDVKRAQRDEIYCRTGQIKLTKDYLTNIVGYEEDHIEMVDNNSKANASQTLPNQASLMLADTPSDNPPLDEQTRKERALMQPKIDALLSALDECNTYAEFEQRLSELKLPNDELINDLVSQCAQSYGNGASGDKPEWA